MLDDIEKMLNQNLKPPDVMWGGFFVDFFIVVSNVTIKCLYGDSISRRSKTYHGGCIAIISISKTRDIIPYFAREISKRKTSGPKPGKAVINFRNERQDGIERKYTGFKLNCSGIVRVTAELVLKLPPMKRNIVYLMRHRKRHKMN